MRNDPFFIILTMINYCSLSGKMFEDTRFYSFYKDHEKEIVDILVLKI